MDDQESHPKAIFFSYWDDLQILVDISDLVGEEALSDNEEHTQLNDKDIAAGNYNDGKTISKNKAKKIANRLFDLIDTGIVDTYKENHDKQLEKMKASEDKDVKFFANYPFDKENVKRFATFCKESGGFEIC